MDDLGAPHFISKHHLMYRAPKCLVLVLFTASQLFNLLRLAAKVPKNP